MTSYRLREDLSFCQVDGHPIFLDMGGDRYFKLSGDMESIFMAWLDNACTEKGISLLVEQKILMAQSSPYRNPVGLIQKVQKAQLSALELPPPPASCSVKTLIEVFATVSRIQVQLKATGIKRTVERVLGHRGTTETRATDHSDREKLLATTHNFLEARKLLPIGTCCLPDSLAMAKFLKKRGTRINIVIGVTSDPFSAHCWAQAGDIVLNDALGNTRIYSPIRVL